MIFISRPISAVVLRFASLLPLSNASPYIKMRRQEYEEFEGQVPMQGWKFQANLFLPLVFGFDIFLTR